MLSEDVNNSFLILSSAIERMAVMPDKEDITVIETLARILANYHAKKNLPKLPSNYPRVYHKPKSKLFIGRFEYLKKRYQVTAKSDYECFKKLIKLEKKIKNEQNK